jgi:hypothetical protein
LTFELKKNKLLNREHLQQLYPINDLFAECIWNQKQNKTIFLGKDQCYFQA